MELVKALTETSSLLARCHDRGELFSRLVERVCYETGSDLAILYCYEEPYTLSPCATSHRYYGGDPLNSNEEFIDFLLDCGDYIVSHKGIVGPFPSLLIRSDMRSAAAFPLILKENLRFLLILNGRKDHHYTQEMLTFMKSASLVAQNALERIEELS